MPQKRLFYTQAWLVMMVGLVHIIALRLFLYWQFPWLDIFVHFFGGLWVGLAAVWILSILRQKVSFARVVLILALMSIGWELFEFFGGIPREANFVFDTALDLLCDLLGGIAGYAAAWRLVASDEPSRDLSA